MGRPRVAAPAFAVLAAVSLLANIPAAARAGETQGATGLSGNGLVRVVPPAGPAVAVVAWSAPVDGRVAIVVANSTNGTVRVRTVVGHATASGGARVVRARSRMVVPRVLAPGEQALGSIRFRRDSVRFDDTFTFDVKTGAARAKDPLRLATGSFVLSPAGTGAVAQTLDLVVTNDTTSSVDGRVDVRVVCLDEAGTPAVAASGKVPRATLAPGATVAASVEMSLLCPVYVVGAEGSPAR